MHDRVSNRPAVKRLSQKITGPLTIILPLLRVALQIILKREYSLHL